MDPVTHALIGLGLAGFSGETLTISNPLYLGACLGAMAPDLDIICQLKGDVTYLKHHRGFTHSIPGMLALGLGIAVVLFLFNPVYSLGQVFLWTFLGTLSHGVMDILNSYGSKLFWPFSNKRWTLNLVNAVDPVILLVLTAMVFAQKLGFSSAAGLGLMLLYLCVRYLIALRLNKLLRVKFNPAAKITVMPSLLKFWCWDCLIENDQQVMFIEVNSFTSVLNVKQELSKEQKGNSLVKKALESKLGKMFREFTPHFHVIINPWQQGYLVKFLDLRYCLKQEFLHSATIFFNHRQEIAEQIFHPYHKNRKIRISG